MVKVLRRTETRVINATPSWHGEKRVDPGAGSRVDTRGRVQGRGQWMPDNVKQTYRIGEVAAQTALSRDTLRYYERRGLLGHPSRTNGGFRVYGKETLERLRFIKRAQVVGLSLDEIR